MSAGRRASSVRSVIRVFVRPVWLLWAVVDVVIAQPKGKNFSGSSSTPLTAWEAFEKDVESHLKREAIAAFDDVNKPNSFAYNKRTLNKLAAEGTQKRIVKLLRGEYAIDISIILWDSALPGAYKDKMTNDVGVIGHECLYTPKDILDNTGEVVKQPCREGGTVFTQPRSSKFSTAPLDHKGRRKSTFAISKKAMLFYTPRDAWSLVSFPDFENAVGPTLETLEIAFNDAIVRCEWRLMSRENFKMNPGTYAQCISEYFDKNPMEYHTALRGVAVVPEIVADVPDYLPPGDTEALGNIFRCLIPLPNVVAQQLPGEMKLWIYANGPVMVLLP